MRSMNALEEIMSQHSASHVLMLKLCVQRMDPQLYKLLEVSWEAWIDSGINVGALRDSNRVGVYTGICGSEVRE